MGDTPFHEYQPMIERYGQEKADRMMKLVLKNYKRLAFINTGLKDLDKYRAHSKNSAEKFGLRYEEIQGRNDLVRKMLYGPWDEEFVIIPPGKKVLYKHFFSD